MSDTSYPVFQHYGTNAQRLAFTPAPPATGQPIYVWYETDTGDTYLYDTSWHLIASAGVSSAITALTGDVTATGPGSVAATLANTAVTPGAYGDATHVAVVTVDAKGRLTAAASTAITFPTDTGITQLTGDVTAGPGSGSQAATIPADTVTFAKMQNIATGKVLGRGSASSGDIEELTPTSGIETTNTPGLRQTVTARTRSVNFVIDGGGSAITTGVKGDFRFPVAGTITKVSLLADQSGSIVVDVWKAAFATGTSPTVANTITAAAKPTISATVNSEDGTLTGWTTSVSAGDCFRINVDSATTVTRVTMALDIVVTG
jgi:hypothetical protein